MSTITQDSTARHAGLAVAATFAVGLGHQLLTGGPNPLTGQPRRLADVIATVVFIGVGAALTFGVLMPLARRGHGRAGPMALVTGIVAVVSLPALVWSAGSMIIGIGAVVLGRQGIDESQRRSSPAGLARAGLALGAAAAVVTVAFLAYLSIVDFNPGLPA